MAKLRIQESEGKSDAVESKSMENPSHYTFDDDVDDNLSQASSNNGESEDDIHAKSTVQVNLVESKLGFDLDVRQENYVVEELSDDDDAPYHHK